MQTPQPNQEQIPINQANGEISEIDVSNKPQQKLSAFKAIHQWLALSLALVVVFLTILAAGLDTLSLKEVESPLDALVLKDVELPDEDNPFRDITHETSCQFTKFTLFMDAHWMPATYLSVPWSDMCAPWSDDMMSDEVQDQICRTYGVTSTMIALLVISMIFLLFGVLIELLKIFGTYEIQLKNLFGDTYAVKHKWIVRYSANMIFFISCLFMFAVVITWIFGDQYCYGDERYLNMDLGTSIYIFIASGVFGFITALVAV